MKGVILAGGTGSRLRPLTLVTNKHLLPVYNKPMIYYPIEFLRDSGITELLIILGGNSTGDFVQLLGDGAQLGVNITYRYQYKADGIAGALKLAREFVGEEPFAVCLGDNIFENPIKDLPFIVKPRILASGKPTAFVGLSKTHRASSFGVPTFKDNSIIKITEKPEEPDSNYAVTGFYCYDKNIWTMIDSLIPSERGELEITDINNWYINNGTLIYDYIRGWWRDAGSIETLFEAFCLTSGMKDVLSGIYQIRNLVNQKIYIGSSSVLPTRKKQHFYELENGKHYNIYLQNAWNKYGEDNFEFEILELTKVDKLLEREKYWIDTTSSFERDKGYNLIIDPVSSSKSEETKKRISISKMGSKNSFYGKTHSEEQCSKISKRVSGSSNPRAKLTIEQVSEIKLLLIERKIKQKDIAIKYNVSVSTIEQISMKKIWKLVEARENGTKK